MLKKIKPAKLGSPTERAFAIIASTYNSEYVDAMVAAAQKVFAKAGVQTLKLVRVPGAFEIPVVASALAQSRMPRYAAIVCLGVILRGETAHAHHIGEAVSHALVQIQITSLVPIIHEVLLLENEAQAKIRCLGEEHNRGAEAAHTALEMAAVMGGLRKHRVG